MAAHSEEQAHTGKAIEFVQYLAEVLATMQSPTQDPMIELASQLGGLLQYGDKPLLFANPPSIHRVTGILHREISLTMSELSHALSVPPSTATRWMNWLVDNGLAQRLPDPDDRRIVRVVLTDSGQRLHEAVESHFVQNASRIMACLTPEEQDFLVAIFRKVASSLKASDR